MQDYRSLKKGVAIIAAGVSTLRIAPPLIISRELIGTALPIVKEAIKEAKERYLKNPLRNER